MLLLPTSLPPSKSCERSIGWSRFSAARVFEAVRSSMPLPNWVAEDQSVKKIAIAFKESRRIWFRDLLLRARCARSRGACDPAHAACRRLDRPGSGARRSLDGARGKGSGPSIDQQCRRRAWPRHAVETPRAAKRRGSDRGKAVKLSRLRHHAVAAIVLGTVQRGIGALEHVSHRFALGLQRG